MIQKGQGGGKCPASCQLGCQINPIDVNFHLQKSLEIFDKNFADKIWSKKDKEVKSALPHAN